MKIKNIMHLEASAGWGGQEMRILKESLGMKNLGYNVLIAVEKNGGLYQQAIEKNIKTYEIRFKKIFWFFSFFKLIYIILKNKIDLIVTHSSSDSWLGGILGKIFKIKVIRTRHLSTTIRKGLNSRILYGYLADFVITTCTEIVTVISEQSKKNINKIKCIPTGIDQDVIKVSDEEIINFKEKHLLQNSFLVGTACFMRSWKGIDDFLNAAKLLEKENIKFLIIGGGHSEKYINLAKELKLQNVFFTGHLENPYPAIATLDIFLLLSTAHEGISQASLQAAFLKKPLITTRTGGLKEVCIDNFNGINVSNNSPLEIKSAIMKIKNDNKMKEKFGENSSIIIKKFTIENMLLETDKIYNNL
ncbi:MAG: hypothetical protein A3F40_01210 [Chlamydiae bacterium RIFCSPHIGHO2_12_FULL_27_8]|nr:MAG: hypothetical protein A3F40_01210 [Chlamydiae bacterium RIFCSPHIGHO2_12_FULL_27_8]